MPAAAQLAVTAHVQVEDTSKRNVPRIAVEDVYTRFLMGVETRRTKQILQVKTYVRDGVVRVEGLAPLRGWPDHLVLISRGDGRDVWLDSVTQEFFRDPIRPEFSLQVLNVKPSVQSKADGTDTLLGRKALATRTEIAMKMAAESPTGFWEDAYTSWITNPVTAEPPNAPRHPLDRTGPPATWAQDATMRDFDSATAPVRSKRITIRAWTTPEFGDNGRLAASTGVTAILNQVLKLQPAGLPLRQVVQSTSSNGEGQRWETIVTSVGTHSLPASAFEVPKSYAEGKPPMWSAWVK